MSKYLINLGEELVFAMKGSATCTPQKFVAYAVNVDMWLHQFCHLRTLVDQHEQRQQRTLQAQQYYFPNEEHEVRDSTSPRERELVVREAREHLLKMINRGVELQMITNESSDDMIGKIG